jgi:hypothetical protein
LVIQWMIGVFNMQNFTLLPLYQEIKRNISDFSYITFEHVYKSRNKEVDQLSNTRLALEKGT